MSYRIVKTSALASLLALSALNAACVGPTPPTPIPSPTPTPTPVGLNYTVSGAVTEMTEEGLTPVEGMRVRVSSSIESAMTDANGFYSLPGVRASSDFVTVTKDGYVQVSTPLKATADTRLDIRVQRIVYYTLSGMAYEVTAAGRVPIEGVSLYCEVCTPPFGHTFETTDAYGLYSFSQAPPGTAYLQVPGKEGYRYVGPADTGLGVPITITGNTRFDVEFVRR